MTPAGCADPGSADDGRLSGRPAARTPAGSAEDGRLTEDANPADDGRQREPGRLSGRRAAWALAGPADDGRSGGQRMLEYVFDNDLYSVA